MVNIRDKFLNTNDFNFQINHQGVVQLSFGPTHICMTSSAAYELQYQLAAFLAKLELDEYSAENMTEAPEFLESQNTLKYLADYQRFKSAEL